MSDIMDFNNQNIEINAIPSNSNQKKETPSDTKQDKKTPINNQKSNNNINNSIEREVVVLNPFQKNMQTSLEKINRTWIDKFFCCFKIFKNYFQITSQEFLLRFLNSLIPFNNKFQNLVKERPDLYGPIWIYTSLIIIISATGSLTRTLQGNNNKNFFQEFVPIAGVVIYGIGFGLPILITFLMKIFGSSLNFVPVICTYGYSFSIFIPITIICVIQIDILQWIVLIYAVFSSTSLLVVNYYKLMGDYSKNKKILIIIIVLFFQAGLLLFFKLFFFKKFSAQVLGETEEDIINNSTTIFNNDTIINDNNFDNDNGNNNNISDIIENITKNNNTDPFL